MAKGIPITEVSRWLGHKSIEVTHQIYGTSSLPPGTAPAPSSMTHAEPDGNSHHPRKPRAESVLTPSHRAGHLPAETAAQSANFTIFEGTSEIQRMIIGRAITGLDVR